MNAPGGRMSPKNFLCALTEHARTHYVEIDGTWVCQECRSEIEQAAGSASIHSAEFGDMCAGSGRVVPFQLPCCPKCEGVPQKAQTCIHIHRGQEVPVIPALLT